MPRQSLLTPRRISVAGLFAATLALGVLWARPIRTASIGFDSQVAVVDFARLVGARHIEQLLTTTPKPLLTFIFGPLELLSHDWRTLAWATLIAFALAVVLTAELARRIGGTSAWAFVGAGLAGCGALLFDVGFAQAIPWGLLGWSVAGLALSARRPRYGLAGIALLLATLARLETLLVVGLAAVVLIAFQSPSFRRFAAARGIGCPPRRAGLILVAFAALPIMGLHDLMIYGDPLFWSTVPVRYSAGARSILSAPALFRWLVERYLGLWPLVVLGLAGVIGVVRTHAWAVLIGLIAFGPGMAAFLLYLAARHIQVPARYAAPIDIAAILAAGIGTSQILAEGVARLGLRIGRRRTGWPGEAVALTTAVAVIVAVVATWPSGVLDPSLQKSVRNSLALAADVDQMVPILREIVDKSPGARLEPSALGTSALLLVPLPYRPRLSIDLDLPLTMIGDAGLPIPGQFVAHDRHADGSLPVWRPYETTIVRAANGVTIVPVASDPRRGWWITEIRAAQ